MAQAGHTAEVACDSLKQKSYHVNQLWETVVLKTTESNNNFN